MMEAVAIPPFERFYGEHCDEVLGYLRRLLGQRAEDAWQETFLRALRAYDRLEHGATCAPGCSRSRPGSRSTSSRRKGRTTVSLDEAPELAGGEPTRAAYERARAPDRRSLPPTERAAVVLRYGYDLPYAEIGAALGSSEEAARAAASSGVRRLRRTLERQHLNSTQRFRAAALARGSSTSASTSSTPRSASSFSPRRRAGSAGSPTRSTGQDEVVARSFGAARAPLAARRGAARARRVLRGPPARLRPAARPARRAVPRGGAERARPRPLRPASTPTATSPRSSAARRRRARSAR